MVKEDQPDGAREKGPDPFMDEYAFILQQADDLTLVIPFWHTIEASEEWLDSAPGMLSAGVDSAESAGEC